MFEHPLVDLHYDGAGDEEGANPKPGAVSQVPHLVLHVATDLLGGEMGDGIFDGVEGGGSEECFAAGAATVPKTSQHCHNPYSCVSKAFASR